MASITVECEITLTLGGDVPEWAQGPAQEVMDEVLELERIRVRKVFERALADRFGAGVLGDQSDS